MSLEKYGLYPDLIRGSFVESRIRNPEEDSNAITLDDVDNLIGWLEGRGTEGHSKNWQVPVMLAIIISRGGYYEPSLGADDYESNIQRVHAAVSKLNKTFRDNDLKYKLEKLNPRDMDEGKLTSYRLIREVS